MEWFSAAYDWAASQPVFIQVPIGIMLLIAGIVIVIVVALLAIIVASTIWYYVYKIYLWGQSEGGEDWFSEENKKKRKLERFRRKRARQQTNYENDPWLK